MSTGQAVDSEEFLACIKELLRVDKSWIPRDDGYSLYLRPTYISTHPFLGVTAPQHVKLYCILSPVGPYYPEGFNPVKLFADNKFVRAWPGGTGASSCSRFGCFSSEHLLTHDATMNASSCVLESPTCHGFSSYAHNERGCQTYPHASTTLSQVIPR
jgi:hypothetical protein